MRKKFFLILFVFIFVFPTSLIFAYDASYVLGQANFTSGASGLTSSTLNLPETVDYDSTTDYLYVADTNNNRVLVFDLSGDSPISNGENAIFVLGEEDFDSSVASEAIDGLNLPLGVAVDETGRRLFVSQANDRISIFDISEITNGEDAINFLGSFLGGDPTLPQTATTQNGMNNPGSMYYDEDTDYLYVTDTSNNRVLVFDVASITNGENAINVLGQADFTSTDLYDTDPNAGLNGPNAITFDEARNYLIVADGGTSRVVLIDISSLSDGKTFAQILSPATYPFNVAKGVAYDEEENILFATDGFQSVFVFDFNTIVEDEDMVAIIGETTLDGSDSGTTRSLMSFPEHVFFIQEKEWLVVVDGSNNRLMIFDFVELSDNSTLNSGTDGTTYSKTFSVDYSQGAVTFSLDSGSLPAGLSLSAGGTISGTPTTAGTYNFNIRALDTVIDDVQEFFDTKDFSITIAVAPSSGGGGGGTQFICTDPVAINYTNSTKFGKENNDICKYPVTNKNTCPYFVGYAKKGGNNEKEEVKKIQNFLNDEMKSSLIIDGIFGNKTDKTVKDFQSKYFSEIIGPWKAVNGLNKVTGWWYKTTSAWANNLLGCPITTNI